jgi:Fic family protein
MSTATVRSAGSHHGTVIAFSGALGLYTGALSTVVGEILGWRQVRFSDIIREQALKRGQNPDDRGVLQLVGQELVRERAVDFVTAVLARGDWKPGRNLILDGLRHAEIHRELTRQLGNGGDLRVVHITMDDRKRRADRARRAEGLTQDQFNLYDGDVTEAQLEETPAYADFSLEGSEPRGKLAEQILRRFVPWFSNPNFPDDQEDISRMEPLVARTTLSTRAQELMREAKAFAADVPIGLEQPLADLVRAMNCYYSNRIEGHNATPVEIELALNGDYESDPQRRYWQAEARAHIAVQRWIDNGGLSNQSATKAASLTIVHDRFFSEFPQAEWIQNPETGTRECVIPGHYRRHYIRVGGHVPPSPGAIPRFISRFEEVYSAITDPEEIILSAAAAHHRLLWIHPFGDGNGRVARLMSDAILGQTLSTYGLWSVSRGLALADEKYKAHLIACDLGRRNDFDGRGNLSEETLADFTNFFLTICLEQVSFMRQRMRLDNLQSNIDAWVETSAAFGDPASPDGTPMPRLDPSAGRLIKAVIDVGALSVAEAPKILGNNVDANTVIGQLAATGVLRRRGEGLTFGFPAHLASRFLPGLFP